MKNNFFLQLKRTARADRLMFLVGLILVCALLFLAIFGQIIAPYDPSEFVGPTNQAPNSQFLMGTDRLGRDVFSRMLSGTRWSLAVALVAIAISLSIGTYLGACSGYLRGKVDQVLLVVMDSLYAFPTFVIALVIALMLGPGILNTAFAVAIVMIPSYYRVVRSVTLSLKEADFVQVEKVIGASNTYIIRNHILPFLSSSLLVMTSLGAARAILAVAGLGFLGLGIPAPTPEWGTDLNFGRSSMLSGIWWTSLFPGIMIFLSAEGFNLLSEGLDAILNPKTRRAAL